MLVTDKSASYFQQPEDYMNIEQYQSQQIVDKTSTISHSPSNCSTSQFVHTERPHSKKNENDHPYQQETSQGGSMLDSLCNPSGHHYMTSQDPVEGQKRAVNINLATKIQNKHSH